MGFCFTTSRFWFFELHSRGQSSNFAKSFVAVDLCQLGSFQPTCRPNTRRAYPRYRGTCLRIIQRFLNMSKRLGMNFRSNVQTNPNALDCDSGVRIFDMCMWFFTLLAFQQLIKLILFPSMWSNSLSWKWLKVSEPTPHVLHVELSRYALDLSVYAGLTISGSQTANQSIRSRRSESVSVVHWRIYAS